MSSEEQTFSIQPHPATTNDPATDPALNGGSATIDGKPGPQIIDSETANKLGEPASREELAARSAELNRDS